MIIQIISKLDINFNWDLVQKGAANLKYVPTEEQGEDVSTKPLDRLKFEYFLDKLGVVQKDLP